jgi:GPH family glycoside/pentoside/hexuronide:cation symporter
MPNEVANSPHGFGTKFFYGLGSVAFGVKDNGFGALLLLFYNQALGLDARLAGLAIAIALVVDAFLDPLIGYASDHLHTRWGRRHPFMYAAAIPAALSYLLLFSPPVGLDQSGLFYYLLISAICVRACIALFEIPNSALVAELTQSYDQRTSYLSFRYFFGWTGALAMSVAAFGIFLSHGAGKTPGTQMPANYHAYGVAAAVVIFSAIMTSSLGTHRAIPWLKRPAVREGHDVRSNPFRDIRRALSSRSAVVILLAGMLYSLAMGLAGGLAPYIYTYFWALTPQQISLLLSSGFLSAVGALFCAPWLSRRFDKRRASVLITIAIVMSSPIALILRLLGLFPADGSSLLIPLLFVTVAVSSALLIVQGILFSSMLADVVEESEVRTGQREEGVFFAANIFVQKCVSGLGVFSSSALLTLAEFPARANPGAVPDQVITNLSEYYIAAFVLLNFASMASVIAFKITRIKHQENLEILALRRQETLGLS